MEQYGFQQDDLNEVVDVFRMLKKWRDEKEVMERQALLMTGTDSGSIQNYKIH